ncbi:uncharacterized protein [Spinacia oleracea]|uniref:DUF4378 domain-containing protein n=1 Tax=Spinacia oleracea TaxID=3562 RepID=A0A9R0K6N9_SPIOL|nr:uncharacterized protein LOC110799573 [Spinacia oleracea]
MATKNGKMLKDFLQDVSNSNSSSGFEITAGNLPRSRSRSRVAAEAAFTSFQKLLQAVKSFHYSSTPSTLQTSVSRRLLGRLKKSNKLSDEVRSSKIVVVTVKVKDILRWKSFRDLVVDDRQISAEEEEEESQPLDFVGPANDAPSTNDSSSNNFNFTVTEEELPCCLGDSDDDEGKLSDVDDGDVVVTSDSEVGPNEEKHNFGSEEDITEQQSPVSVLNSPFRDEVSDEEIPTSFEQKMANMERTKQRLLQSIQWFENLAGVREDDDESIDEDEQEEDDYEQQKAANDASEAKRKAYSSRGFCWFKRGKQSLEDKEECVRGMEKLGQWNKFEEERTELGVELEVEMLSDLLDEVLIDFDG